VFIPSQFIENIQEGNAVIVLDEFNRIEPWLHNTLYPLLDTAGCTVVHDQAFVIGPNVVVCATINTGYRYTGTFELDEALSNRFDFTLEVGPMPHNEEVSVLKKQTGIDGDEAGSLVKTANVLRGENISCSTRSTLEIAKMIVGGMSLREALEFTVVRRIPQDESGGGLRKQALDLINTRHGPFNTRNMPDDIFGPSAKESTVEVVAVPSGRKYKVEMSISSGTIFRYLQFMELVKALPLVELTMTPLRNAKKLADLLQSGQSANMVVGEVVLGTYQDHVKLVNKLADYGVSALLREIE
jgi:hypothetical protein